MWRRWSDWALAALLLLIGELEFWFAVPADAHLVGGGVPTALFFAPVALVLGLRRREPGVVVVAATVGFLAAGLFVTSRVDTGPVAFFVALIIAFYSAGGWSRARLEFVSAALAFSAVAALDLTRGVFDVNGPTQPLAWLILAIAWLVGREIGRRRQDLATLRDHTSRLELDRELETRAAVQEERTRIARELHDVVAHSVSVMVVQAQAGTRLVPDPQRASSTFQTIEHSGREALVELRRMLGILRTPDEQPTTHPQPGLAGLDALVAHVAEAGVAVQCVVEGEPRQLPPGVDLSAYRIIQEALTNTLKHAGAAQARVVLRYLSSSVEIEVLDDGRGSRAGVNGSGHGLIGMRERAALHGGDLSTGPRADGGYAVVARLPLQGVAR
jgi:signal transduction histidine kinase